MNANTYHLDQNVRGQISKGLINNSFLYKCYPKKIEAISPFALLEYAGIGGKEVFLAIPKLPNSLLLTKPLEIKKVKEHFEKHIKQKITKEYIKEKLEQQLKHDNEYARPFIIECINILPEIYDDIINQLSWDRFTQMQWSERIKNKRLLSEIRAEIARLVCRGHLYVLRHCHYINQIPYTDIDNEPNTIHTYVGIMQRVNLKPNIDIGDCEFVHIAINGQSSSDYTKRRIVDCYTMDPAQEIKRRLILCLFYYEMLEKEPIQYKFQFQHCGKIYIINSKDIEKEVINVKDYLPNKIMYKIAKKDPETLYLLNN